MDSASSASSSSFIDPYLAHLPAFLKNAPQLWLSFAVLLYVLGLGLGLTNALKRQRVSLRPPPPEPVLERE